MKLPSLPLSLSLSSLLLTTAVSVVNGKTTRYEELAEQSIAAYKTLGDAIKAKAQKPGFMSGVWKLLNRKDKKSSDVQIEFNRMAAELMLLNEGDLKAVELLSAECVPPQKGIEGFKAKLFPNDTLLDAPLMQSSTALPICKTVPRALTTLILMRLALVTSYISGELSPLDPPPGYLVRAGVQLDLLKDLAVAANDAPAIRLHRDVLAAIEKRLVEVVQAVMDEQVDSSDTASDAVPSTAEPKSVKALDTAAVKSDDKATSTSTSTGTAATASATATADKASSKTADKSDDSSSAASEAAGTVNTVMREIIVPVTLPGPGPSLAIPGCSPSSPSNTLVHARLGLLPGSDGGSLSVVAFGS
jgi:hypothetical protein